MKEKTKNEYNIVLSGVGGQGVLTIAGVIARAAFIEGHDIKASELHGLAMRFGAIEAHLRIGKNIHSPLVTLGNADLIISQEPLEALRVSKYANKKTTIIFDTKTQVPVTAYIENTPYPSLNEIKNALKNISKAIAVNASEIVNEKKGSEIMANTYLLGRLAAENILPMKKSSYIEALKEIFKPELLNANLEIFELGYQSK